MSEGNMVKNMAWTMKSLEKANLPKPDTKWNVISQATLEHVFLGSLDG